MARTHKWFALAVMALSLTGCVSQDKYTALKLERDRFAEQLNDAQLQLASQKATVESLNAQLAALNSSRTVGDAANVNKDQQILLLTSQLDEINRKYAEAMEKLANAGGVVLPPALNEELRNFANQNPDLVDFDSARGMVKFKSDVTFALGDATVTPKAREAITRFAGILNSPAAAGYELLVAGHTDNTPVHNPATVQAGHKDNWFLSAHRAISVGAELQRDGVAAARLGVVGYADQRPVASNGNEAGKAQNRRVEVLILPTTVRAPIHSAPATPTRTTPAKRGTGNKDSSGPTFNK